MRSKNGGESPFGRRLRMLRQASGLTQTELAKKIGGTQKMITHYENRVKFPPVEVLPKIARALKVTTDELVGHRNIKDGGVIKDKNLMRRFNSIGSLSLRDQRTVFSLINALKGKHLPKQTLNRSR